MTEYDPKSRLGIVTKLSPRSVPDTVTRLTNLVTRLTNLVEQKRMTVFAVIDQAAVARLAGFELREMDPGAFRQPGSMHTDHGGVATGRPRPATEGADLV